MVSVNTDNIQNMILLFEFEIYDTSLNLNTDNI